jgi:epoxyqueuosine reductase
MSDLVNIIKAEAASLGFSFIGFAGVKQSPHFSNYLEWIAKKYFGEMTYLSAPYVKNSRSNPTSLLNQAESVIVLGISYKPLLKNDSPEISSHFPFGRIAAYAQFNDYHHWFKTASVSLMKSALVIIGKSIQYRIFIDSGTLMEKDFAYLSGLGWIGRNSLFISPEYGSYCLLGCILTDLDLPCEIPPSSDLCAGCSKCIQACPSHCINPDRTIDARRCIAYLTIEHKGDIPYEYRELMGNHVFGCDVCQQVCPLNAEIKRSPHPPQDFGPLISGSIDLIEEIRISPQDFKAKYGQTPLIRVTHENYLRNLIISMGNSKSVACVHSLGIILKENPSPILRSYTAWSLGQIHTPGSRMLLDEVSRHETDPQVREEILAAISTFS